MITDAERLARYDRLYAGLLEERRQMAEQIGRLKAAGKERSATCRQLIAAKMTLQQMIGRFEQCGLEAPEGLAP